MYKTILLPVDLNQEASWQKALPAAVDLCTTHGARLKLLSVVPGFTMPMVEQYFPADAQKKMLAAAEKALEAFARDKVPDGLEAETLIAQGEIYEEVIAAAGQTGADLIVMGGHVPELKDYVFGTHAARVARHATVSVMVVR